MSIVFDTPEGVDFYFLAARASALKLQRDTGLTHSRGSVMKFCKEKYGITGNTIAGAAAQMEAMVEGAQQAHAGKPSVSCTYSERVEIVAFIKGAAMYGLELEMPAPQILRRIPWDKDVDDLEAGEKRTKTITWTTIIENPLPDAVFPND